MGYQPELHPLTEAQESLLARGPIFFIVLRYPPRKPTLQQLKRFAWSSPQDTEELWTETSRVIKRSCPLPSQTSAMETRVIKVLKEDRYRVILTADKRVAMVVMDKKYIDRAHHLLPDLKTYRTLNKDPINKLKNKLAPTLRDIKTQGGHSDHKYKRLYATSAVPPCFIGSQNE